MTAELLLAIDNGTQSVRALVFDLKGNMVAKSQVKLPDYLTPAPGLIEQEPQVFWEAVCQACQGLWQMPGVEKKAIVGVAVTTQRNTMINLDKQGEPLRPAITWMDQQDNGAETGWRVLGVGICPDRYDRYRELPAIGCGCELAAKIPA